ncbi:MAG: carbonic anhydrase [Dehalococcoidia bacterium]
MQRIINGALALGLVASLALNAVLWRDGRSAPGTLRANVPAAFNPTIESPRIGAGTYIDPLASVIGDVRLGRRVMVAPFASIRGDEGQPIRVGSNTNIQDGVVLHALETIEHGEPIEKNLVEHNGRKYAIYVGDGVSLAHQSLVHGPAKVGDGVFVGMQAMVFRAEVGAGAVIEPAAKVIGVKVAAGRYVPAGAVITSQAEADALPIITPSYIYSTLNDGVVRVNTQLADGYLGKGRVDPAEEPRRPATAPAKAADVHGDKPADGETHPAAKPSATPTTGPAASATARPAATVTPRAPAASGH